jgi:dsDNA-binding SOS-regulon protein
VKTRRHKYGAQRTEVDGVKFSSKAEARRYQELRLLEKAGEVKELELQPKFPLHAPQRGSSQHEKVSTYIADFRYRRGPKGVLVIEDVKGMRTPLYRLKKKWMEVQYGLKITEVLR